MIYKNISKSTKTFYGIQFKPGDQKEVCGYINDKDFVSITKPIKERQKQNVSKKQEAKQEQKIEQEENKGGVESGSDNN